MPVASIVVPTFQAGGTLGVAVRSALRQSVDDIEVLIMGDGVDDATRSVALGLAASDERVRFSDLEKSPGRGEAYRDRGVREAQSNAIVYLADDDILLPRHVANMLDLLSGADLVQSRNGWIDASDQLQLFSTDLSDPDCVSWHFLEPPRNCVSLTGTAHSRNRYLDLERGWEIPPLGLWADLHLWRAFFAQPDFIGATHTSLTTLQFPSVLHSHRPEAETVERTQRWAAFSERDDVEARVEVLVDEASRRQLIGMTMQTANMVDEIAALRADRDGLLETISAMKRTVSWRVTAPLRWVRGGLGGRR